MDSEGSGQVRRSWIRVEIRSESDRPNYEMQQYVICESLVQHMFYVLRSELAHVLGMVTDLLWANEMLLLNWIVMKVGFEQDGICPPIRRDILWGPRVIRPG